MLEKQKKATVFDIAKKNILTIRKLEKLIYNFWLVIRNAHVFHDRHYNLSILRYVLYVAHIFRFFRHYDAENRRERSASIVKIKNALTLFGER